MIPLYALNASELSDKLQKGEITPAQISESCLVRIREVESLVGAWAYVDEANVRKQIDKISACSSADYPMWGIPVGVKDIYNTFDMPTEMGSVIWKDFTPGNDARVVHYLRRAGALMLGKTVTAEFAVHHQEETKNPYDLSRSPGTSSSGSAVAVATGMVPVALGSQTAGSIGRPASYCGVYGFKPSFGVLPRIGVLKTTDTLDTLGFFARSVDDLPMVFDAARVHGQNYEFVHQHIDSYRSDPNRPLRVGILKHPQWHCAGEFEKTVFFQWVETLRMDNVTIEHVDFPEIFADIYRHHETIYDKSLAYYFKDEAPQKEKMSRRFLQMIEHGESIGADEYLDALEQQRILTQTFNSWVAPYDILITLGTAGEAPVGLLSDELPDSNLIWTFFGVPALMMPALKGKSGLPVGVLCIAKKYDDPLLLDFARLLKHYGYIRDVMPVTPNNQQG